MNYYEEERMISTKENGEEMITKKENVWAKRSEKPTNE